MHAVLLLLEQKEKQLREYEDKLLNAFDSDKPGAVTRDYVNKETAKNEDERTEIGFLQARLNELSAAAGQSTSAWTRKKATDEFVTGIEKGQKVEKGFFSTLFPTSAVFNNFYKI